MNAQTEKPMKKNRNSNQIFKTRVTVRLEVNIGTSHNTDGMERMKTYINFNTATNQII